MSNRTAFHHIYTNDLNEAEKNLKKAIGKKPDEIDIIFNLAVTRYKQHQFAESLKMLNNIDEKTHKNNVIVKYLKFLNQIELGNIDDAKQSLQEAENSLDRLVSTFSAHNQAQKAQENEEVKCHAFFDDHRISCKKMREELERWKQWKKEPHPPLQKSLASRLALFNKPNTPPQPQKTFLQKLFG